MHFYDVYHSSLYYQSTADKAALDFLQTFRIVLLDAPSTQFYIRVCWKLLLDSSVS